MKKLLLFIGFCISFQLSAQNDSLELKKITKDNHFKVAGRVLKNNFLSIPGDFSEIGKSFSKDWKKTATYTGGILGLIAVDTYTTDFLHEHIEPTIDYSLPRFRIIDNDFQWFNGPDAYITYSIASLYAIVLHITNV